MVLIRFYTVPKVMGKDLESEVENALPELSEIRDHELREKVTTAWVTALSEVECESFTNHRRSNNPIPGKTSPRAEKLVPHIRDVTACVIAIINQLEERIDVGINRDRAVAGALVHDISKLYEFDDRELDELIPHPHFAIYVLENAGISTQVQHIALAHTESSRVKPRTIEAELVRLADLAALHGLFWSESGSLAPHV